LEAFGEHGRVSPVPRMIVTRLDATDAGSYEFPTRMATFLLGHGKRLVFGGVDRIS